MTAPYYSDEAVTLYHGKCEDIAEWLEADVLVTDPPYGRGWKQGSLKCLLETARQADIHHDGIAGDLDTAVRDAALARWGGKQAVVFGDLMLAPPAGTKLVLIYGKAIDAGTRGATAGFRRDAEAIYLIGPWPSGIGGRSSIITSGARKVGGRGSLASRYQHPHAKPVDVMETLIEYCPPGIIADPFAGSGSTLVAARNLGRRVIGVELEERHCEQSARRLSQMVLT